MLFAKFIERILSIVKRPFHKEDKNGVYMVRPYTEEVPPYTEEHEVKNFSSDCGDGYYIPDMFPDSVEDDE